MTSEICSLLPANAWFLIETRRKTANRRERKRFDSRDGWFAVSFFLFGAKWSISLNDPIFWVTHTPHWIFKFLVIKSDFDVLRLDKKKRPREDRFEFHEWGSAHKTAPEMFMNETFFSVFPRLEKKTLISREASQANRQRNNQQIVRNRWCRCHKFFFTPFTVSLCQLETEKKTHFCTWTAGFFLLNFNSRWRKKWQWRV